MSVDDELAVFCGQMNGISYEKLERRLGISHSTLHRRFPVIMDKVKAALNPKTEDSHARSIVRAVLALSLVGQMSSRNVQETIALVLGTSISHDTVLDILSLASGVARDANTSCLDLKRVKTASFDEIFQNGLPILNFVDNRSAVTLLASDKNQERSGESWAVFLRKLREMGLDAETNIGDGGLGLTKGLEITGARGHFVLDLFHCLMKCFQAKKKAEGICYALILAKDNASRFGAAYYRAEQKMNMAIEIFDQLEPLYNNVKKYAMLAHPGQSQYMTSDALLAELVKLAEAFDRFHDKVGRHKKLIDARNYLKNHKTELTAYKKAIESEIRSHFGVEAQFVFDHVLPVIEFCDQYDRSYENSDKKTFWSEQIIKAKARALTWVPEGRFDAMLNSTAAIVERYARSNSLVENINNQIRRYMDTYKRVPGWFCDLFSFYWNFRRFKRGKRAGLAPIELLMGARLEKHWLDILLDSFPYQKLRLTA
jgi:hypothetical protein